MKLNKNLSKLNFKVINISSINEDNIVNSKIKFSKLLQKDGYEWVSERFCIYPQEITIKFDFPVYLYQINLLCNEKKTPKHLVFHSFCPEEYDDKSYKYSDISFNYIGYVDLKDNRDSNYQVREYKKVFINIRTLFLKILLDNNYINNYNKFQQVGIINIECLGKSINNILNIDIDMKDKEKQNQLNNQIENIIKEILGDKYEMLLKKYINFDKIQNSDKYLKIKNKLEELNNTGKKIFQIKLLEKNASNKDDFNKAIELKNRGEKYKYQLNEIMNEINKIFDSINNNQNLENEEELNEISNINNSNQNFTFKNNNNFENENKGNKKILFSFTDLEFNDSNIHDEIVIPTAKKHLQKNKSVEELIAEEENKFKKKLGPPEELNENNLNDFKKLIYYLNEDGLRYLLSNQNAYKTKGFNILASKLNDIFLDDNINELIYELIDLEALFLDDKNISSLVKTFQLIKKTINFIIDNDKELKTSKKLLKYFKDRIIIKIQSFLGNGEIKIRNEASKLYLYILKQNLFNFNSMITSLLSNDVNENIYNSSFSNSQNLKILSKLTIIKYVLEDYVNITNNFTTEESFPKDLILDYILINIKNNNLEIKKITRELLNLASKIFGPEYVKQKIYFHINDEKELVKLISQISSLRELFNDKRLFKSNSQPNIIKQKEKKIKLKKNVSQIELKNNNKNKTKYEQNKSKKNKNKNICDLCNKNIDTEELSEHPSKCLMCGICEGCGENVSVEKMNYHKLNLCENKKKFRECKKCKEAIKFDLYDLHIKKNTCNIAKEDMLRCPLCHHDIEKNGFYQHLVIDGCAYQKKY